MEKNFEIHIEETTLSAAEEIYSALGLSVQAAVRLFLNQSVLCKGLPFELKLPKERATQESCEEPVLDETVCAEEKHAADEKKVVAAEPEKKDEQRSETNPEPERTTEPPMQTPESESTVEENPESNNQSIVDDEEENPEAPNHLFDAWSNTDKN